MEGGGAILPPIAPAHASKSHRGIHVWYGVWSGLVCKGQCVKRVEGQRERGWGEREGERGRERERERERETGIKWEKVGKRERGRQGDRETALPH